MNNYELKLSPLYYEIIQNLWSKELIKSFSAINFLNKIEEINVLFQNLQFISIKNYIIFILNQLHSELKDHSNIQQGNANIIPAYNQYDKNIVYQHFINKFQRENSIISNIFNGIKEITNECLNCKNKFKSIGLTNPICYNYQIFNCVIFSLDKIMNMKQNSSPYDENLSLYECFLYNQKAEIISGNNKIYCQICKENTNYKNKTKIYKSPKTLIIILDRDKVDDIKIDYKEEIDITQFVIDSDKQKSIYNLYGFIIDIGKNNNKKEFVAVCKSPVDDKWYRYNDNIVIQINDIYKEGIPYALFYNRKEEKI